jgi:hypothetical protein
MPEYRIPKLLNQRRPKREDAMLARQMYRRNGFVFETGTGEEP